jgi:hypothetical protein
MENCELRITGVSRLMDRMCGVMSVEIERRAFGRLESVNHTETYRLGRVVPNICFLFFLYLSAHDEDLVSS